MFLIDLRRMKPVPKMGDLQIASWHVALSENGIPKFQKRQSRGCPSAAEAKSWPSRGISARPLKISCHSLLWTRDMSDQRWHWAAIGRMVGRGRLQPLMVNNSWQVSDMGLVEKWVPHSRVLSCFVQRMTPVPRDGQAPHGCRRGENHLMGCCEMAAAWKCRWRWLNNVEHHFLIISSMKIAVLGADCCFIPHVWTRPAAKVLAKRRGCLAGVRNISRNRPVFDPMGSKADFPRWK